VIRIDAFLPLVLVTFYFCMREFFSVNCIYSLSVFQSFGNKRKKTIVENNRIILLDIIEF
jgi:hypothetical protein